jgi:L-gulonate 5-dehydrogenase
VVLRTETVSICSTDVSYFRGHLRSSTWPVIPGHEYVGTAVSVGRDLKDVVALGDRVSYWGQTDFGGMAEYRAIRPLFTRRGLETTWYTDRHFYDADQAAAVIVPATVPSHLATLMEPLTSVLRSLLLNPPRPGDSCAVLGCGPSALLAIQVLDRFFGVGTIIAIDHNDYRLQVAKRFGASQTFHTATQLSELDALIRSHHDQYVDYVFDALPHVQPVAGRRDPRELAMGLLRPGGDYVIYGASAMPQHINTWMILAKGLNLKATPFDVRLFSMRRSARVLETASRLIETGVIEGAPLVTRQVSLLDEAAVVWAFTDYGSDGSMKTSLNSGDRDATNLNSRRSEPAGRRSVKHQSPQRSLC